MFQQIFDEEGDKFYKKIKFSKKELHLTNEILIRNNFSSLSDKILDKKSIDINLENNAQVNFITKQVDMAKKYSVGNCTEIALIAMEYIATHDDKISAELFEIAGGDHVFLVVNRDPKSDSHDPLTWGDSAYICDPWANKVYPAKEYLKELKNFQNLIFKT